MGNTCFTLISSEFKKADNNQILLNALKEGFGIDAQASGRNDLVTSDGRKANPKP